MPDCPLGACQPIDGPKNQGCPNGPSQPAIGNPCSPAVGNKYEVDTDTRGGDSVPALTRHYNSQLSQDRRFGYGWTSSLNKRLAVTGFWVRVQEGSGRGEPFNCTSNPCVGDVDTKLVLTKIAGGYALTRPDGSIDSYNTVGRLQSEVDRAAKVTAYTYDNFGRLSTVTGPFGHVLTLGYDANSRVGSLTDPAMGVTQYTYTGDNITNNLTRVDYPDGTAKIYHYEDTRFPHHLTGISLMEASGTITRYATYAYDTAGKAILTEHTAGQERFTLTYDTAAQTTVRDAANTAEVMTFATNLGVKNLVSKINQSDGKTLTQTFDAQNNLTCQKDEEGRVTTWTYNATNRRTSMTEGQTGTCTNPAPTAATRTTTYQYLSPTLDLPTVIESPSVYAGGARRTSITYSGNLPVAITQSGYTPAGNPVGRAVTLGYNASGQVTRLDGPRSDVADVTTISYYECTTGGACGQLKSLTNALGHTTTYDSYDAAGRLLRATDPNGLITTYQYDPRGRVLSVTATPPAGTARVTQYRYTAAGDVSFVGLPDGRTLTYTYDAARDLRRIQDNLGNRIDYAYDAKGNRTKEYTYDPSGTLVRSLDLAYDLRNRVSALNAGGSLTQQLHDAVGNLVRATDPNANPATEHQYDGLNRLLRTVDALGGATAYAYDVNDRPAQVLAPNAAATAYAHDDLGNLLEERSPDRGRTTYAYDAAGNLVSATDARGVTASYSYDALNRVSAVRYTSSSTSGPSPEDITYRYDVGDNCAFGVGRLCAVQDASGTSEYGYDPFGNVTEQRKSELGVTYVTRYTYDAADRLTSLTYPDGRLVTYARDGAGRVSAVATTAPDGTATTLASGIGYRADGLLTTLTYGSGLPETRTHDLQGRLTYQSLGAADTRLYGYDANGNLTALQSLPQVSAYGYDPLDRLNAEQPEGETPRSFGYDPNGNRTRDGTGNYAYLAASNRLVSAPDGTVTLDAAGNTLADATRSLRYDLSGRLSEVSVNGRLAASHVYDHRGLRTRKTTAQATTLYHYDLGGRLLQETDATGQARATYAWLDDRPLAAWLPPRPSDPRGLPSTPNGQGAAAVAAHRPPLPAQARRPAGAGNPATGSNTTATTGATPVLVYLHPDPLGTPRLATDAAQRVVWRYEGEAFGATAPSEDPDGDSINTTVNLRFAGTYYDAETSLWLNGARYYDPKTGRFITADPTSVAEHVERWRTNLGVPGQPPLEINPYARVVNNPLRWNDPTGEAAQAVAGCAAGSWLGPLGCGAGAAIATIATVAATSAIVKSCEKDKCPPCKTVSGKIVPVGTIGYRPLDTPSKPQHGIVGPHYNIYKANQYPAPKCDCFWQPAGAVPPSGLPAGAIPIEPFVN
jgi:RHS repeat-associated protein